MVRTLTPKSSLENLKREAKRWLKALRGNDPEALARLKRANPKAPTQPTLRDVQLALAREFGLSGWDQLKSHLSAGANASVAPELTALLDAASTGDAVRVGEILDAHPELIDERGVLHGHSGLRTALHFGVHHREVVRLLLERGADPNIRDEGDDAMPLHFAAERGDMGIVRMLVEHGADTVGDGTMHELNVLGWAICWDYVHNQEVAEYLLAHGARHTIHTAVALGDVAAIRDIATRLRADVDLPMDRTNLRRRPIHLAVVKQQPQALETLLDLGADVDARDARGLTALDQSALNGEAQMARLLVDRGARIDLPAAIALDRAEDLNRLLSEDPGALKRGGRWASLIVHVAARSPGAVIERLIRAGADVNVSADPNTAVDQTHNYTALHNAAWNGNTDAIRVLLKHGANARARDSKYCGTPAGWANYNRKPEARDLILEGEIDPFDAINHDRLDRLAQILDREPEALNRPFREYADCEPEGAHITPLAFAVKAGKAEAERILRQRGASETDDDHAARVARFLQNACLDWRVGGSERDMALHLAGRLLRRNPEIARENIFTAVACGELETVARILRERPRAATEAGGSRGWPPIVYLATARLNLPAVAENAVAIARALLDTGADPNSYYLGGSEEIHYSVLTGVMGEGEENATRHPRARELVALLLENGAEPYDSQVMYNTHFHGPPVWLLELMYEHSVRRGRKADWDDPEWHMLDAGGYGCGARYVLGNAVKKNDLEVARWCLTHGASPNPPPARGSPRWKPPQTTLYQEARGLGYAEMAELLAKHGAPRTELPVDESREFAAACLRLDGAEINEILKRHPEFLSDPTALHLAAAVDRADVVTMLLDRGVSPDVPDPKEGGQTALHVAAYQVAPRVATVLIERGAAVDPVDSNYGGTPLGFAVYGRRTRMIDLLSQYSRDIWHLTFMGKVERVRELLGENPALARVATNDGETLLMWLPDDERRALELTELLLSNGADATARDAKGMTAEDWARRRALDTAADRLRAAMRSRD